MYPMGIPTITTGRSRARRGLPEPKLREDGRWWLRLPLPPTAGKPRPRKPIYGATEDECRRNRDKYLDSGPSDGRHHERATLREMLDAWLKALDPGGPEAPLAHSSWVGYETHARRHIEPWLGHLRVRDLRIEHVETWLADLKAGRPPSGLPEADARALAYPRSQAMRRKVLVSLRTALKWGKARGYASDNVAAATRLPKKPRAKRWEPLPDTEVDRILAGIKGHRLEALFAIAIMMGPRQGEILGLWWSDLDREKRTIEIGHTLSWSDGSPDRKETKTSASERTIRLPDTVWDLLMARETAQAAEKAALGMAWDAHRAEVGVGVDDDFVFTTSTGRPCRGDGTGGITNQFQGCLKRAGVARLRFHDTRHMAATLLLSLNGNNLIEVGQILGHSTYRLTVDLYAHLRPEVAAELAARVDEYYKLRAEIAALRASAVGISMGSMVDQQA